MVLRISVRSKPEEIYAEQVRLIGLPTPTREHKFDAVRRWRFDFAWPSRKVAVEIEGGVFVGGRHTRGRGFEQDIEKYNTAAVAGWTVLRFTPKHVTNGEAMTLTEKVLLMRPESIGGDEARA